MYAELGMAKPSKISTILNEWYLKISRLPEEQPTCVLVLWVAMGFPNLSGSMLQLQCSRSTEFYELISRAVQHRICCSVHKELGGILITCLSEKLKTTKLKR